jgi:hypothetical protein
MSLFTFATALAQSSSEAPGPPRQGIAAGFADAPSDPGNQLKRIQNRATQTDGLIPYSPIQPIRDGFTAFKDAVYDATSLKLGLTFHHVFAGASDVLPGTSDNGAATEFDFVGSWELFNRGQPTQGELVFGVEGRWEYGYGIGPEDLGIVSIPSAGGTALFFSEYNPNFLLRDLYYRQGGPEAGWGFRLGKITTDAMLLTNRHITPHATFLPNASAGLFANGYPDSGLGIAGALYPNDRMYVAGLVSDANGDRFDWGDISEGDFFKAVEFGLKIAPRTEQASYSKFLLWHTDGTKDGKIANAQTGVEGWGFGLVVEQELTADGRLVLIGRYARNYDDSAVYDQQAGVHLLLYQPTGRFDNDVIGTAFNWVDSEFASAPGVNSRDEYNWEIFYRFPLLPDVDTSLHYQAIIDPAFGNTPAKNLNFSSVYLLRLATSF